MLATDARSRGALFEDLALAHVQAAGLVLVERNFLCRHGEIDLVMRDGAAYVFVEVRQRDSGEHGGAAASITPAKIRRLVRAASAWLAAHPRMASHPCRFDVLAIGGDAGAPVVDWRRNAFEAS
jgi:putative endonuclease